MAKTNGPKTGTSKPNIPPTVPSHGKGGKINESVTTGTGPRKPEK